MVYKKIILSGLLLLLLIPLSSQARCSPYFAEIDSIEPEYDCLSIQATGGCGGEVEVINHCRGEFYFYDQEGELDESLVLINNGKYDRNYQKYQELEKETGKEYWGFQYRDEPRYYEPRFYEYLPVSDLGDCGYRCPNDECHGCRCRPSSVSDDSYCVCKDTGCRCDNPEKIKHIINGVNVCDPSEIEKAGSGTVVKHWTIKMFSKEDNQDITIKGRTIYKPRYYVWTALFYISIFILLLLIALVLRFVLKKKTHPENLNTLSG